MTIATVLLSAPSAQLCESLGGVYADAGFSPVSNVGVFSGSLENQVFFVFGANGPWTALGVGARSTVGSDGGVTTVGISVDGSVTACAVAATEGGSELHVIKTPVEPSTSSSALSSIKIFASPLFPIRSVCFGLGGRLKTKLFVGTDEGNVFAVSLSRKGAATLLCSGSQHGGVKCVRSCPLTGHVAVSFCDGAVVLFDQERGLELESRKVAARSMLPESVEKFGIDWHPKGKEKLLAVAGGLIPVVLRSGSWATTPVEEKTTDTASTNASTSGILSVVRWSLDGVFIAGATATGAVYVWEYSGVTGPRLVLKGISDTVSVVNFCWAYDGSSHVVNCVDLKGGRCAVDGSSWSGFRVGLKIDLAALAGSSKDAAVSNMESGLVEEERKDRERKKLTNRNSSTDKVVEDGENGSEEDDEDEDGDNSSSSDNSSDSSSAESVDESPEQLREELMDLVGGEEEGKASDEKAATDDKGVEDKEDDQPMEKSIDKSGGQKSYQAGSASMAQFTFQPGATSSSSKRRILCWNQNGRVVRTDFGLEEGGLIEVQLDLDTVDLKQFRLRDSLHGWSLASLGTSGLALGVRSKFDLSDKYEEDEDLIDEEELAEKRKNQMAKNELTGGLSKVCFRPFAAWGSQREWILALPVRAEIEGISAGSAVVAAVATDSVIRVWSVEGGFLLWTWSLRAEVPIAVCSHKDVFMVVSAMRSRSTETMVYETFSAQQGGAKIVHLDNGFLPVTVDSALCWVGVSEESVPFSCDTHGVVRGLFPCAQAVGGESFRFSWVPLLNFVADVQKKTEGYWPVFVSERDVWCVATRPEEDFEPKPSVVQPAPVQVPFKPQGMYVADNSVVPPEHVLMVDRLVAGQARFCDAAGIGGPKTEAKKTETGHDKKLAETFRKLLESGKPEKALGSAALAFTNATSRLMIRMAAALGLRPLEARLEELFNGAATVAEPATVSAAAALFPAKVAGPSPPLVEPARPADSRAVEPRALETQAAVHKAPPANPFAKKRKGTEEPITRNA